MGMVEHIYLAEKAMMVCQSFTLVKNEISCYRSCFNVPHRMNHNDFSDPLTFPSIIHPTGPTFYFYD